jgi:hypothetical protein
MSNQGISVRRKTISSNVHLDLMDGPNSFKQSVETPKNYSNLSDSHSILSCILGCATIRRGLDNI